MPNNGHERYFSERDFGMSRLATLRLRYLNLAAMQKRQEWQLLAQGGQTNRL